MHPLRFHSLVIHREATVNNRTNRHPLCYARYKCTAPHVCPPTRLRAVPTQHPPPLLVNGGLDQAKFTCPHEPIPNAMAPKACPACLDLDYDNYAATPGLEGVDQSLQLYPLPRYRIVPRLEVAAAADSGCDLCRVLREGMLHFWGIRLPKKLTLGPTGLTWTTFRSTMTTMATMATMMTLEVAAGGWGASKSRKRAEAPVEVEVNVVVKSQGQPASTRPLGLPATRRKSGYGRLCITMTTRSGNFITTSASSCGRREA